MFGYITRLGLLAFFGLGSVASASNADIELTGRVRMYKSGTQYALQIDVKNDSKSHAAFGPDVYVRIKNKHGHLITEQWNRKLYQYFGGTATTPNTVNPKQLGYIPLYISAASGALVPGQELQVKISGDGPSNFGSDSRDANVCQKGTSGCL